MLKTKTSFLSKEFKYVLKEMEKHILFFIFFLLEGFRPGVKLFRLEFIPEHKRNVHKKNLMGFTHYS